MTALQIQERHCRHSSGHVPSDVGRSVLQLEWHDGRACHGVFDHLCVISKLSLHWTTRRADADMIVGLCC